MSDLRLALVLVDGEPEQVPNFADVEFIEVNEAGFFFQNDEGDNGLRWASRLQTWLELQRGDGRQQDAARELKPQILKDVRW